MYAGVFKTEQRIFDIRDLSRAKPRSSSCFLVKGLRETVNFLFGSHLLFISLQDYMEPHFIFNTLMSSLILLDVLIDLI